MRAVRHFPSLVLIIAVCVLCGSFAYAQTPDEREFIVHALSLSYGQPSGEKQPQFAISPEMELLPTFSEEGTLIEISMEPKSRRDPSRASKISRTEFESVLATISSIKSLGIFEQGPDGITRSGWRDHARLRYHNAYLETNELVGYGEPKPIESARIYYLHAVSGVPKFGRDEKPDGSVDSSLVCVDGKYYIASKSEFVKLWSKPNERQTVQLAGPTMDYCSDDQGLKKRDASSVSVSH